MSRSAGAGRAPEQATGTEETKEATTKRGVVVASLGLLATGGSRFCVALLIGRVGGPALLGASQSALSSAQLLALVWPTSAGRAASKHFSAATARGDVSGAAAVSAAMSRTALVSSICLATVGAAVAALTGGPRQALAVAVLTIALCLYPVCKGLLLAQRREVRSSVLEWAIATASVLGVAVMLAAGVRSVLVILPVAFGYLGYALASRMPLRGPRVSRCEARAMRKFIALGAVGTLASAGFAQAAVLVAARAGGRELAGQYAAAMALVAPVTLLATSMSLVLFPSMARLAALRADEERALETAKLTAGMISLAMIFLVPGALLSPVLTVLVWGDPFETAAQMAPFLMVASSMSAIAVPAVNSLTSGSLKGLALSALFSSLGALVGCLTWALIVPVDAELGVPAGYLVGTSISAVAPIVACGFWLRPNWNANWLWFLATGPPALAAAILLPNDLMARGAVSVMVPFVWMTTRWWGRHQERARRQLR